MENLQTQQRPALLGLDGDLGQGLLGHPRIMLEKHAGHFLPGIEVAHIADKADHRADADIGRVQGIDLGTRIKRRVLDPNGHVANLPLRWGKRRLRHRR